MSRALAPVSVVIPTYGRAEYLLAALDSVLTQTRPAREVIVVDDGSPDDTGARVELLVREGRIRYVRRENGGMAVARNTGAALATSDYILFLDDDDLLAPNAVEWLVDEIQADPALGFVFGDSILFSGPTPPTVVDVPTSSEPVDRTVFLLFNQIGSAGQVLIRRSAFEAIGGWRDRYPGVQDWDLWLRLLARYPARRALRPAMAYRLHDNNMSRDIARMYQSSFGVARAHLGALPPDRGPVVRRYTYARLRRYHSPRRVTMARDAVSRRQWSRAARAATVWGWPWAADVSARVGLKAHLLRHGRWRLPASDPVLAIDPKHLW